MASVCRDDSCLRSLASVVHRNSHEKLMHPTLIRDAAIRLIQRVVSTNSVDKCKKKVIATPDGKFYSYYDALQMSKNPEEAKDLLNVFETIVKDFFLQEPDKGVRELLSARQYRISK